MLSGRRWDSPGTHPKERRTGGLNEDHWGDLTSSNIADMRNGGIIRSGFQTQRWASRAIALALSAAIALAACGSDDSGIGSATELSKGSCLIGASQRTPVAIGTQSGRNVRVTGTFDVARDGGAAIVCLENLQIDATGDIQIRLFNGLFGDNASGEMTLTPSDMATYTSFSVRVDANESGSYSIGFYEGSGDSLNELASSFDETAEAQAAAADNAAFLRSLCSTVSDSELTAAFPHLAGSTLVSNEYSCSWPTAERDPNGLSVYIRNPNSDAGYIAGQRESLSGDGNVELGDLAVFEGTQLKVFSNGFLIEMNTYAEVADRKASMTAIAAMLIANL
jgi:hypothetical protein